ncbi:ThiF family adenylyltransferase [Acinetobacter gyllenbergii]|uniref:ThiF family adenylyltransferase n=1 Tax=Acinetobacter gyllenbergii TaxID=134534 RepID=UPI0021D3D6A2|nr:ThiF family adenylyltransferase [Acinetobacter gyllenbergii]MCU4581178.1 ThiF family adenylyltransferase [Acinetobacter gyllenbergii]
MSVISKEIQQGIDSLYQYLGEASIYLTKEANLKGKEVASYRFPLPEDHLGVSRVLRITFCEGFPATGLNLQIEPSPWLLWPHAMQQSVCLYGFGEQPAANSSESVVSDALRRLSKMLELVLPSADHLVRDEEFHREISSYWKLQLKQNNQQLVLLEHPSHSGELIGLTDPRAQSDRNKILWLASNQQEIEKHLFRILNRVEKVSILASVAFFIRLSSYPNVQMPTSEKVFEWLHDHIYIEDYHKLLKWDKENNCYPVRWLLLEIPNTEPPIIQTIALKHKGIKSHSQQVYGKRAGRRLRKAQNHTPQLSKLEYSSIHLLARNVIHSRNLELRANEVVNKKVAVIGVGSLGSSVVMQLVRAGIKDITLIDPDKFESANLGRHVLGVDDLGKYKTDALRDRIHKELSNTTIKSIPNYIQYECIKKLSLLDDMDVVLITSANWNSEEFIWLLREIKKPKWSLIQTWAEPHAIVGHVIISAPNSSADGRYLFDINGNFKNKSTEWERNGVIPLPGCGEGFIPGGPINISTIANIAAQSVFDVLTKKIISDTWVTSIGDIEKIFELNGKYIGSEDIPKGCKQIVISRDWPQEQDNNEV